MKNIKNNIFKAGIFAVALTSLSACIEETEPMSSTATTEQVQKQEEAATSFAWSMPAKFNDVWSSDRHYSFGYGALMQVRDQMTQDLGEGGDNGYTWWNAWAGNLYQGDGYIYPQFIWNSYWGFLLATNTLLESIDITTASAKQQGLYATGLAQRALIYLDMARMYEFLPNDIYSGENEYGRDVTGLTLPIVTEKTTAEEARNNPRAPHEKMVEFIKADLETSLKYIDNLPSEFAITKTVADKACVYGLLARLYLWDASFKEEMNLEGADEAYKAAADNARQAIKEAKNTGVVPMTQAQCLDTKTGFNNISCWMWGSTQNSETPTVKTGIINWTSWLSNQTTYGYTGSGTGMYVSIDKSLYDRISDSDFRKLMFVAPANSPLADKVTYAAGMSADDIAAMVAYASVKFRPNDGNCDDYNTGSSSAYPIMRVEEMYFIEAEATAHLNPTEGLGLLKTFMKEVGQRNPNYNCMKTEKEDIIEEIVFQKRIELWGEGQTFFDVKRLNMPVVRGYEGTNHPVDERLNTTTRPAWMNIVMVRTEQNNNHAVMGWNNPNPTGAYPLWEE